MVILPFIQRQPAGSPSSVYYYSCLLRGKKFGRVAQSHRAPVGGAQPAGQPDTLALLVCAGCSHRLESPLPLSPRCQCGPCFVTQPTGHLQQVAPDGSQRGSMLFKGTRHSTGHACRVSAGLECKSFEKRGWVMTSTTTHTATTTIH